MLIIQGHLDDDFKSVHKNEALLNVAKLLNGAKVIEEIPSDYGRESFLFVYNHDTEHFYCFPGIESENRENGAARVKKGVSFFVERGFVLYTV